MDEYISREAVFQVVHGIARGIATKDTEAMKVKDMKTLYKIRGAKEILDLVDTDLCYIPVADVQTVKRGKWEEHHATYIKQLDAWFVQAKCSCCGRYSDKMDNYSQHLDLECCSHCGARMDGDVNG